MAIIYFLLDNKPFIQSILPWSVEEQIKRTYNATEVVENTSEYSLQKSTLELYKFSLEYEPSETFQLEYNILLNSSDQSEVNDLTSIYGRLNDRVEENFDLTRTQTPKALNQELKVYYIKRGLPQ